MSFPRVHGLEKGVSTWNGKRYGAFVVECVLGARRLLQE